jgi:hypothetical protein
MTHKEKKTMHSLLLILAACVATAVPAATPVGLDYKDSATYENRAIAQYQAIEFRDTPITPLVLNSKEELPSGVKYGFLQLGPNKDTAMVIVWAPKASDGPWLQLFSNADGKPLGKRQKLSGKNMELPVTITVATKPSEVRVERTLLFRTSTKGDGLRYAVRGYAQGRLKLGGAEFAALLIDGNADGLLDTVGRDRLWIDLDGNGQFDLLMEQYPLGKPIVHKGDIFVVRSDPLAAAVVVNQRNVGESKLRLTLAAKHDASSKITAELVSDIGEFVSIDKLDEFVSVPYGEYRISSVSIEVPDASGKNWSYRFYSQAAKDYSAPQNIETTIELMKEFEMKVAMDGGDKVNPGTAIRVTPNLVADVSLELSGCNGGAKDEGKAEVLLLGPDGKTIQRTVDGFG